MSTPPTSPASSEFSRDPSAAEEVFFAELLPAGPSGESAAETESRVLLDLESTSPLPVERLAYGWMILGTGEVLYYAAPRDRMPPHDTFAPAGSVVPSVRTVMLPEGVAFEAYNAAKRDLYADVRPRPELMGLRSRAVADGFIGKIARPLRFVAAFAVVLLAAGAVLWGYNDRREAALAEQASAVKRAEERLVVLGTLEKLDATGRSIFDALAMVNPSRPESVGFSKASLTDNALLSVDGRSSEVSAVNRMQESLKATGNFGAITIPKLDAASGRANFSMKIPVTRWAPMADAPTQASVLITQGEETAR